MARLFRLIAIAVAMCLVGSALVACSTAAPQDTPPPDLPGTKWVLAAWSDTSIDPAEFDITASFAKRAMIISGSSGVNRYEVEYVGGANGPLTFGTIISTKMAGEEDASKAEAKYLELLKATTASEYDGDTLRFLDVNGAAILTFKPQAQPTP